MVAIKFVTDAKSTKSATELRIFKYLDAYQRPNVEKYGIPNVYYSGQWNGFSLIALTKLDRDLLKLANENHKLQNPLDVLILMKNFVGSIKNCY